MCLMAKSGSPMSQGAEMELNQLAHNLNVSDQRKRTQQNAPKAPLPGRPVPYIFAFCVPFECAICSICCRWLSIV
jgi:hypothetical protein